MSGRWIRFVCFFFAVLGHGGAVFSAEWDRVYLASFPRSGNHWTRFLIEEATHIATGSVYKDGDYPHLPTLFPWGGYCTNHGYNGRCAYPRQNEPVVLKTHYPCFYPDIQPIQRAAVCLIRHPIDAFYSYNVYSTRNKGPIPKKTLCEFIKIWRKFYEFWDQQPRVLLVRYEDMYQDPSFYLTKILQTIGYPFKEGDVQRAVRRYPPRGGILKHIGRYEKDDIELIKSELGDLLLKYGYLL